MVGGSNTTVDPVLAARVKQECKGTLCVDHSGQPPKTRRFVVLSEFGPDHTLGVYNNDVNTVERAFIERYFLCNEGGSFRPALPVKRNSFRLKGLIEFRKCVMKMMPYCPKLTKQQVVDTYHGPKRRNYQKALLSLDREPLCARDASLTSFVKFEKQDIGKAPRMINPRSARYNLCLGQYLKVAEHHYFRAINKAYGAVTPATVIKGLNADASAEVLREKWDRFENPVAVGLDATKLTCMLV